MSKDRTPGQGKALLVATLFMACGTVCAQQEEQQQKESPPAGGTPRDFTLPQQDTEQLENGLRISAVQFGAVPKATLSVVVSAGNLNEGDKTWLADMTGDFLLEGTTTRSAEA
ncbi:MAG TPA: hypothetical protein VMO24_01075, partial [Woeseiaceae bacterium]|nr:hypothetical protein [Woeseiaceae bacterium]